MATVLAGNNAQRLPLVKHTTRTIHYHHVILYDTKNVRCFVLQKIRSLLIKDPMLFIQYNVLDVVKTMSEKLRDV